MKKSYALPVERITYTCVYVMRDIFLFIWNLYDIVYISISNKIENQDEVNQLVSCLRF